MVCHRFGNMRFLAYAKPKPGITFWLGGKKWKIKGIRSFKPRDPRGPYQYVKEIYTGTDGWMHHVEIKDSEYKPYLDIRKEEE